MKNLILVIVLIFSNITLAGNWMAKSKILAESIQAHELKTDCERISGEACFDIGSNPSKIYSEVILKGEVESCLDQADCDLKHSSKVCLGEGYSSIKNYDLLEVYCVKSIAAIDPVKQSSWLTEQSAKAQSEALESAIKSAEKLIDCGKRVKALLLVRNASKGLITTQVKTLVSTYQPIDSLLGSGSLNSAKEEIMAVNPDGVIVTSGDKTALISEVDKCLGL